MGKRVIVLLVLVATMATTAPVESVSSGGANVGLMGARYSDVGGGLGARYDYVVLLDYMHEWAQQIKAEAPATKVLMYKNVGSTANLGCDSGDYGRVHGGVGYCEANAEHPEWFLHDHQGARIEFCDWPGLMMMDVGNHSYQKVWLDNVVTLARERQFDGVMMDDVNMHPAHCADGRLERYSDDEYRNAVESFLAHVGPGLQAHGLIAAPNIAFPYWYDHNLDDLHRWAGYTSGIFREHWTAWSGNGVHFTDEEWEAQLAIMSAVNRAGKPLLAIAPDWGIESLRYGRATFMLGWNGDGSAFFHDSDLESSAARDELTMEIGAPLGDRYKVGVGWRRDFTRGVALVNPSSSEWQHFSLGRSYRTADGTVVESIDLAPATGRLLADY
ncbi:MAG: putative glycoside hydrolase family 15 protein [Actinomycetota bacterium]|nr:putative glycoside hydrolase family 15 protein [Actinomycetota bacterium]